MLGPNGTRGFMNLGKIPHPDTALLSATTQALPLVSFNSFSISTSLTTVGASDMRQEGPVRPGQELICLSASGKLTLQYAFRHQVGCALPGAGTR